MSRMGHRLHMDEHIQSIHRSKHRDEMCKSSDYGENVDESGVIGHNASSTDLMNGSNHVERSKPKSRFYDSQDEAQHGPRNGSATIKLEPSLQQPDVDFCRQHPTSSDDLLPSSTSQQPFGHSLSAFSGNLVIKVQGDSLNRDVSQPDVVSQLSRKLGVNVVLQMENSDGEVLLEEPVTPAVNSSNAISIPADSHPGEESEYAESKLFSTEMNGEKHEPVIVNTVLNTIRELATRLGRMEQLRDCPICGDTVTGFHYGVQTCESCKGFFKRTVQNKKSFKCLRNGDCEVYLATRKKCPACRFQKCCDVGMKVEGIREDRSRGGRSTYDGASAFVHRRFKRVSESADYQTNPTSYHSQQQKRHKPNDSFSPEPLLARKPIIPELLQQILALEQYYEEVTTTPQPCCVNRMNDGDKDKFNSMLHITEHRLYQIVKWARHLPSFLNVHTADQVLLLQNAWAELTCLGVIWRSRETKGLILLSYGKTIDMAKAKEMDHEEVISRMLYVCESFRRLKIDQYEYVTLKVLALMLPDIKGLENSEVIQEYQNSLLDALMTYTTTHYPEFPLKFGELLLRLSEVQRLTAISRQQMLHLQSPELEKNSLLMELLRHQSFGRGNVLTDAEALNVINTNYKNETITPQYSFTGSSSRPSQRTPGVAVVAPHTARTDHLPSSHQRESATVKGDDSDRLPCNYGEGAPSKPEQLKSIAVQTQHQPVSASPPAHSPVVVTKAKRSSISKQDYTLRSPQLRQNSFPSATDISPPQSPLDRSMDRCMTGRPPPSSAKVNHSDALPYRQSQQLTDKRAERKQSETEREPSPNGYYTRVNAHTNPHPPHAHPTDYSQSFDRHSLNSLSSQLMLDRGGAMMEAGKRYSEHVMGSQLLAAHHYATLANNLHTNLDMPQDFSMCGSRLAHSYDPGGS